MERTLTQPRTHGLEQSCDSLGVTDPRAILESPWFLTGLLATNADL